MHLLQLKSIAGFKEQVKRQRSVCIHLIESIQCTYGQNRPSSKPFNISVWLKHSWITWETDACEINVCVFSHRPVLPVVHQAALCSSVPVRKGPRIKATDSKREVRSSTRLFKYLLTDNFSSEASTRVPPLTVCVTNICGCLLLQPLK